ncbi:MAG TPA: YdjY domain-containing protein [Gemmataceae bacterium]|jgi:hypothetical protein|nr:YdjY domain-containing protein [Gemmataceae bacterium]
MKRLLIFSLISLVVMISARAQEKSGGVVVDKDKRTITVDCKIAPRKMEDPKFQGKTWPIEVIACYPYPKGQKAHETVVTIDVKPSEVHKALQSFGLKPGTPVRGEAKEPPQGPEVSLFLEISDSGGRPKRVPIERTLIDPKTNKPMPKVQWRFTGSIKSKPDPAKDETVYGADMTGTLISIFPVTDETVFQTNLTMKEEKYLKLETDTKLLPPVGTPVKLVIEVPAKK